MIFQERQSEYPNKKKLIKVDENNVPTGEPDILVNIAKDEGNVYVEGTPINAEILNKMNWKDESLIFKNLQSGENLPNNLVGSTQIAASSNGEMWIIPSIESGLNNFQIKNNTVLYTPQTLTEEQKHQVRQNIGAGDSGLALGESEYSAYRGDRGKFAYDHTLLSSNSNPHGTRFEDLNGTKPTYNKSEIGLGNVEDTADSMKNVLSATKLTTGRTINGINFDGSENITLPVVNASGDQLGLSGNKSWTDEHTFSGTVRITGTLII